MLLTTEPILNALVVFILVMEEKMLIYLSFFDSSLIMKELLIDYKLYLKIVNFTNLINNRKFLKHKS